MSLGIARLLTALCRCLQLAAVQFHLINTTILMLSREGFRRGCLRTNQVLNTLPSHAPHFKRPAAA